MTLFMMIPNSLERRLKRIAYNNCYRIVASKIHFSFLVQRNRIICWGHNRIRKTHTLAGIYGHRFSDIHSEIAAISSFPYSLKELRHFSLINLRIRRDNGNFAISRPCLHCQAMLSAFNIDEIYFTNYEGGWSKL